VGVSVAIHINSTGRIDKRIGEWSTMRKKHFDQYHYAILKEEWEEKVCRGRGPVTAIRKSAPATESGNP
jgi:hypothetical protein